METNGVALSAIARIANSDEYTKYLLPEIETLIASSTEMLVATENPEVRGKIKGLRELLEFMNYANQLTNEKT